mgnify:CR=1 FL=1
MRATQTLHNLGQSLWLDNITRDILNDGTLERYIRELSVTGLTSNPTIFSLAIEKDEGDYSAAIGRRAAAGADAFTIYPYQLGHENDEALRSGAWWFYQKSGFRPRDPVETLTETVAYVQRHFIAKGA